MSRYQRTGNPRLEAGITAHLAALANHPECPNACLAATARRLYEEWRASAAVDWYTAT